MPSLFDQSIPTHQPLAERLRPKSLDEFVGQTHLLGADGPLKKWISLDRLPSIILWGPAGSGKTTLAHLIARSTRSHFVFFSAVLGGVAEVREIVKRAEEDLKFYQKKTILFVDEIHRLNKSQQDAFLPHVEKGTFTLIGATTENPSFEVIGPLLSRTRVLVLKPLAEADLDQILNRALDQEGKRLNHGEVELEPEARAMLIESAMGDARRLLGGLEGALAFLPEGENLLTRATVESALQKKALAYDKQGEEHYNIISAFIKSMRASDPDATLYWLARMLEAGEEPLFVARRMVIFASEDVGMADPQGIQVAVAAMQAFDFVGMPEGWIPLAHAATYLATAPKSRASYNAYKSAKADVEKFGNQPVPMHLRNAPTALMKALGYAQKETSDAENLPEKLKGKKYFQS